MMYRLPLIYVSKLLNVWLGTLPQSTRMPCYSVSKYTCSFSSCFWPETYVILTFFPISTCVCADTYTSPTLFEWTASLSVSHRGASALAGGDAGSPPDRSGAERGPWGGPGAPGPWALSSCWAGEVQAVHRRPGEGGEPAAVPLCSAGEGPERPEHCGPTHRRWREGKKCICLSVSWDFVWRVYTWSSFSHHSPLPIREYYSATLSNADWLLRVKGQPSHLNKTW